jgi:CheY-like chemotaxis protein
MVEALGNFVAQNAATFAVLQAVSSAVSVIGWLVALPILIAAIWRGQITRVKAFGFDVTLAKKEATVALSRATRERDMKVARQPGQRSVPFSSELSKLNSVLDRAFSPEEQDKLIGKAILWVDDNPLNNANEVTALRKIGFVVTQVQDTEAGLQELEHHPHDMVISDMGRGTDTFAGYTLLQAIRARQNPVPFIIYSAEGSKPEHRAAAIQRSALGSTDYPHELLELIISRLTQR